MCGDAVGDGLLHGLPGDLSHHHVGEAVEHLGEEGHQSDLKLRVCRGGGQVPVRFGGTKPGCMSWLMTQCQRVTLSDLQMAIQRLSAVL